MICSICKEWRTLLHPASILAFKKYTKRCVGCGRVLGRCPTCGDAWVNCDCTKIKVD